MPKYDAFGREIGEDTLAGLGGSDATVQAAPAPAPADVPEAPVLSTPDAPPRPIRVRRARGLGCLVGLVILAAVVAGPIIAVVSIVGDVSETFDEVTGIVDEIQPDDPPAGAETPEATPPPAGIEGRSMIAPAALTRAFERLRGDGVKRVAQIRVEPSRVNAQVIRGRRGREVQLGADGSVERGDPRPDDAPFGTIPLAALDPRAPARLVRGAAKRFRVRPQGINYLIASPDAFTDDGGHRWVAYFKNGIYVEGDERGRVTRRIS